MDAELNKAIPSAKIFFEQKIVEIFSKEDGSFQLELMPGKHKLVVEATGYYPKSVEINVQENKENEITLKLMPGFNLKEEVTVTAKALSSTELKEKSQGSKFNLTAHDIYSSPGGKAEVFDVLKSKPGATSEGDSSPLAVRGGDPEENLYLFDQTSLINPYHMHSTAGVGGLLSVFDSTMVEDVAFFSGGFGAKYGDVLSGVLDIKTRSGNETVYSGNLLFSLGGLSLNIKGPLKKNSTSFILSARKNFSELLIKQQKTTYDYEVFPHYWDMSGKITQRINNSHSLELYYFKGGDNMKYKLWRDDYEGNLGIESEQDIVNLRHIFFRRSKKISELSLSRNVYNKNFGIQNSVQTRNRISQYNLRWDFVIQAHQRHSIETGLEIKSQKYSSFGYYPENEYEWTVPGSLWRTYQTDVLGTKFGAYIQNQIEIGGNLICNIGIRGDYFDKIKTDVFDFRTSLAYALNSSTVLKASTGTYHQFPYLEFLDEEYGNLNLEPMRAYHFVFGIEKRLKFGVRAHMEFYYKKYQNLILKDFEFHYSNEGYGIGKGIEFLVQKSIGAYTGWLTYSYSLSRRKELDSPQLLPFDYDIPHNLTFNSVIKLPWNFELGSKFRYASGRPYTPIIDADYNLEKNVYYPIFGKKKSSRFPDYKRLDIRLSKILFFRKFAGYVFFELENVFNHRNVIRFDYSEDYSGKTPFILMERFFFVGLVILL
ncbi:TonB-dependent receptor domain-containing protein [Acidobacteriota bacterium]